MVVLLVCCIVVVIKVDLLVLVKEGKFCEDLFYCFDVVSFVLLLLC